MLAVLALLGAAAADTVEYGVRLGELTPLQLLSGYEGFVNDFQRHNDAYNLVYHVGDSARTEQRTDSGEVSGTYAFVAPEGNEFEFKYEANSDGFKVEGDALPERPDYTDDVKAAREAFFDAYEKQAELTKDYSYESGSNEDGESSEESSESIEGVSSSESGSESGEDSDEGNDDHDEESAEVPTFFSNVPYPYSR